MVKASLAGTRETKNLEGMAFGTFCIITRSESGYIYDHDITCLQVRIVACETQSSSFSTSGLSVLAGRRVTNP